ncbi:MAG: hypothetical protein ACK40K_05020 [Raineya sp.]
MSEKFNHIVYLNHPRFTVGHADQWGESGYLLYENQVYEYWEDRKDQYGEVLNPRDIPTFLEFAKKANIAIPRAFMDKLSEAQNDIEKS